MGLPGQIASKYNYYVQHFDQKRILEYTVFKWPSEKGKRIWFDLKDPVYIEHNQTWVQISDVLVCKADKVYNCVYYKVNAMLAGTGFR